MSRFIWLRTGVFFFFFLSFLFTFVRNFYDFLFFSFFPFYLFFIGFFFATCSSFVGSSVTSHTHTSRYSHRIKKKRKNSSNCFGAQLLWGCDVWHSGSDAGASIYRHSTTLRRDLPCVSCFFFHSDGKKRRGRGTNERKSLLRSPRGGRLLLMTDIKRQTRERRFIDIFQSCGQEFFNGFSRSVGVPRAVPHFSVSSICYYMAILMDLSSSEFVTSVEMIGRVNSIPFFIVAFFAEVKKQVGPVNSLLPYRFTFPWCSEPHRPVF